MEKGQFKKAKMVYTKEGLFLNDVAIMHVFERRYIQKLVAKMIDELNVKSVIEVGFGLGYTAEIFECMCDEHILIEANDGIFEKAEEWAKGKKTKLIHGFVQDIKIERKVDLLFDDRQELVYPEKFPKENYRFGHYYRYVIPIIPTEKVRSPAS